MTIEIDKKIILDSYILNINDINFLNKDGEDIAQVKDYIMTLKDDNISIEEHIEKGKELWKLLFKKAIFNLTGDLQGCKTIFKYFDAFIKYEPILFGVDELYRDHTLHSLWVYFIGEYLLKNKKIDQKDIQVSIELFETYKEKPDIISASNDLRLEVLKNIDEMWCIIALTHDLGYPLSRINKINERINDILPFFGNFIKQDFILEQSFIQKEMFEKMVEIISSNIQLSTLSHRTQILEHGLYLSLYESLEDSEHGILSAYLVFKSLSSMIKTPFYRSGEKALHDKEGVKIFLSNQAILKSIALHTCKYIRFSKFPSFESILIISDEVEEFSRETRAKKVRSYVDELCKVNFNINNKELSLQYIFTDEKLNIDISKFFKNKCTRFFNLFNNNLENIKASLEENKPPMIEIIVKDNRKTIYKDYHFIIKDNDPEIIITTFEKEEEIETIKNKEKIEEYFEIT